MRTVTILCMLAVWASVCDAQWVQTSPIYIAGRSDVAVNALAVRDAELFAGASRHGRPGIHGDGIFHSTDNGNHWVAQISVRANAFALHPTYVFAGTSQGVLRSSDSGASWTEVNKGLTNLYVSSLAFSDQRLFAGTRGSGVFLSDDYGTNWIAASAGLTDTDILALAAYRRRVFAGTAGGVFRSTNDGTNWTLVNTGLTNTYISSLAVYGEAGWRRPWLLAGTCDGVFLAYDYAERWTQVSIGLPVYRCIKALAISTTPPPGENFFAGTDSVFLSTNLGVSWHSFSSGLTIVQPISAFSVSDTYIFAGTRETDLAGGQYGDGVWRRPLSEVVTDVENGQRSPQDFVLEQNYPNPFNPSSRILYALPRTSFVTLKVYNTLGQQIAQLVNEQQQAGYHDVVFRGDGLTSGVYFYRLEVGAFMETKKLVIMR